VGAPVSEARGAFYNKPVELKLERTTKRHFRDYRRQHPGEAFAIESFYPIGWSREGKFACSFEPDSGDCDCYVAKFGGWVQEILNPSEKRLPFNLLKDNRFKVAEPTGLEPATSDVTGQSMSQLFLAIM